jgi:hypothetical protein
MRIIVVGLISPGFEGNKMELVMGLAGMAMGIAAMVVASAVSVAIVR